MNGTLKVQGTDGAHVVFSHPPGAVASGDADPIAPGTQTGPPKWEGIRVVGPGSPDPMSTGHEIRYADFINAQPAVASGNQGSRHSNYVTGLPKPPISPRSWLT